MYSYHRKKKFKSRPQEKKRTSQEESGESKMSYERET